MEKRRHLKSWVVPALISIMLVCVIGISTVISNVVFNSMDGDNYSYVLRNIVTDALPVNTEVDKKLRKPYDLEEVKVHISFYDNSSDRKVQEKSLILYENTYMPNTGILYGCDKQFEIISIYEGEIISINEDDVFGNIIEIKHNNNLISKYSSLSKVNVKVGDTVNAGEVIGMSGTNKLVSVSQNMLLFELMYNGTNVNPESFYDKEIDELV